MTSSADATLNGSPPAPQAVAFDAERGVKSMGSEKSFRLIAVAVIKSLKNALPEMHRALNEGDVAVASSSLHSIKAYVPLMCHDWVVDQVSQVEAASKKASADELMPLYTSLEPVLYQLLDEIQAYSDHP